MNQIYILYIEFATWKSNIKLTGIQNATYKEQIENEGSSPPGLVIMTYELKSFSPKSILHLVSRKPGFCFGNQNQGLILLSVMEPKIKVSQTMTLIMRKNTLYYRLLDFFSKYGMGLHTSIIHCWFQYLYWIQAKIAACNSLHNSTVTHEQFWDTWSQTLNSVQYFLFKQVGLKQDFWFKQNFSLPKRKE